MSRELDVSQSHVIIEIVLRLLSCVDDCDCDAVGDDDDDDDNDDGDD